MEEQARFKKAVCISTLEFVTEYMRQPLGPDIETYRGRCVVFHSARAYNCLPSELWSLSRACFLFAQSCCSHRHSWVLSELLELSECVALFAYGAYCREPIFSRRRTVFFVLLMSGSEFYTCAHTHTQAHR